jgi:hypothetical protein
MKKDKQTIICTHKLTSNNKEIMVENEGGKKMK